MPVVNCDSFALCRSFVTWVGQSVGHFVPIMRVLFWPAVWVINYCTVCLSREWLSTPNLRQKRPSKYFAALLPRKITKCGNEALSFLIELASTLIGQLPNRTCSDKWKNAAQSSSSNKHMYMMLGRKYSNCHYDPLNCVPRTATITTLGVEMLGQQMRCVHR